MGQIMEVHTIAYSKSHRPCGKVQARGKIDDEANTLSTGDGCTNQSTGNYVFTKEENMSEIKIINKDCKYDSEAVLDTEGIGQCLRANKGGTSGNSLLVDVTQPSEPTIRIRKLTPVECERLQGYPDGHTAFGRRPDGSVYEMSNTQRYKMCGNGISSPVPAYLFPKIFGTDHIRVMSLFSGCGGTELLLPSNFEVVGHCEFDKHASAVLNYHYPNIPNFHDVTEFVDKEVPEFDMLVGGFPCFTAGTLVTTSEGLKKIEDIRKGDLVLTHTNQFKKVVIPMRKVADHYNKLKIQGVYELQATDEHPFYVRRMGRKWNNERRSYDRVFSDPKWVDCRELSIGDFIGIPLNKNSIVPTIEGVDTSSEDLWRLVGRYLADGYRTTGNRVGKANKRAYRTIITCGHHEYDEVNELITKAGYAPSVSKERTSYKFNIGNKYLWDFLEGFGRGAASKRLPGFVFDLPVSLLKPLIEGYLSGDGFEVKYREGSNKDQLAIVSISLELLTGFQQLIQKVYRTHSTITKSKVPPTKIIEGRTVNQNEFYTLRFYKTKPKQSKYHVDGDYIWTPFKSRTRVETEVPVYNFEVEDDNSYCVHNLIVHNCQAWSIAGLRKGFDDQRGQLIYNVFDILRKHKPKFLCLENVKGLLSKDGGDAFEAIMEYLSELGYELDFEVVNSKHFGLAQNRERVFIFGKLK